MAIQIGNGTDVGSFPHGEQNQELELMVRRSDVPRRWSALAEAFRTLIG
jgi:hypothetical protein